MPETRRINMVHRSLSRPLTILGAERKLFFFAMCIGAGTFNLLGSLLGISLGLLGSLLGLGFFLFLLGFFGLCLGGSLSLGLGSGDDPWVTGALAKTLPKGIYRIAETRGASTAFPTWAALAWVLGGYSFSRYKSEIPPARAQLLFALGDR